jgi:hypothetical protein
MEEERNSVFCSHVGDGICCVGNWATGMTSGNPDISRAKGLNHAQRPSEEEFGAEKETGL